MGIFKGPLSVFSVPVCVWPFGLLCSCAARRAPDPRLNENEERAKVSLQNPLVSPYLRAVSPPTRCAPDATLLGPPASQFNARAGMSAQGRRRYIYASAALDGRCPGGVEGARGGIMDLDRDLGPGRSDSPHVLYGPLRAPTVFCSLKY